MLWIYLNLIIVFFPAYFFPFSKKKWNKHPKFFKAENWMQLRIDINFDLFRSKQKAKKQASGKQKKHKLKIYSTLHSFQD